MPAQEQFLNAKRAKVCQLDNIEGQLFCKRVVTGDAETLYGYVVHPATWESRGKGKPRHKLSARKRCYIGRLSRYFTGRRCIDCQKPLRNSGPGQERCRACKDAFYKKRKQEIEDARQRARDLNPVYTALGIVK